MAYALIDWDALVGSFTARLSSGRTLHAQRAESIVTYAREAEKNLRVNEQMDPQKLVEIMAACIFQRVPLMNMAGAEITETPVPDAKVSYITREQLGPILPDGWYIECQLNRYAACWGDAMTFPARRSIEAAIADMRLFLAASIKQANDDLQSSIQAGQDKEEMEQRTMWVSSDRP